MPLQAPPPMPPAPPALRDAGFRLLFEALPAECYVVDPATLVLVDCNALALEQTGFPRDELVGWPVTRDVVLLSDEEARRIADRVVAGGLVRRETRHRTKHRGVRDVMVSLKALTLDDAPPLVLAVVLDVSDRRRWEARLRASEERFRALFDDSPVAAAVTSAEDLRIVDCNEAYARLLGYAREELVGQSVKIVTDLGDAELRALDGQVPVGDVLRVETTVRTRSGALREVLYAGRKVRIDGRLLRFGTLVDITERKDAERDLRRSAAFEQRIVGIVSHDLRNPLAAIALQAASALRDPALPEGARRALTGIASTARGAGRMIRDLLDYTRTRHDHAIPLRPAPVDLGALTRQTADEILQAFPGRQVRIDATGDLTGTWDGERLAQVVSNLLANAATYGAEGSVVDVGLRGDARGVTLTVHNEGPAIPAAALGRLFEAFQQGDEDAAGRGVGLGLFIVRHFVEAHGGEVEVASSHAAGTTFTVRLPRGPG